MIGVVSLELLEELAGPAQQPAPRSANGYTAASGFDLDGWIARSGFEVRGPEPWQGGRRWVLNVCPWDSSHTNGSAFIVQGATGMIGAGCHHNGCSGHDWHSLRDLVEPSRRKRLNGSASYSHRDENEAPYEPDFSEPTGSAEEKPKAETIKPVSCRQFVVEHPRLNEPIIHGICRQGETINLISASKIGKSWQLADLLLCVCTGREWLGAFACEQRRVLLIDNELHGGTLAYRLHTVAQAKGIRPEEYQDNFDILSLRGRLCDLFEVGKLLEGIEPGKYGAIGFDAWYRGTPEGHNENDNSLTMRLYNHLDQITSRLQCAWINIHHSSKGSQSDKRVTDVGSGAGAQARAADCHLIMREHEEPGCVVLEAALRSFPPVEPLSLRWVFPLWHPDDDLNPEKLKGRLNAQEQKRNASDLEGIGKLASALAKGPATTRDLRGSTGLSRERCNRLLDNLEAAGKVKWTEQTIRGNVCRQYELLKGADDDNEVFRQF